MSRKKKSKKNQNPPEILTDNNPSDFLVIKEFRNALKEYLELVSPSFFLSKRALYEIPWFLVFGPENSGKSTILSAINNQFIIKYPLEKGGETASGVKWLFGNKVVFIDLPGRLISPELSELFQSVCKGLSKIRTMRPVDGIICVVDSKDILNGSQKSVKNLANSIKKRVDELIKSWGNELPVFCIFNKMDTIPGFMEVFNDSSVNWSDQFFGSTFTNVQKTVSPYKIFLKEYDLIISSLKKVYIQRLSKEKNEITRRDICRFIIKFEGMKTNAGYFLEELFKDGAYDGKPTFQGFYFIGNKIIEVTDQKVKSLTYSLSETIINHPLNPYRNDVYNSKNEKKTADKSMTFFCGKLFDEIISNGTQTVMRTCRLRRKDVISYWVMNGAFAFFFVLVSGYLLSSFQNAKSFYNVIREKEKINRQKKGNLVDAYNRMQTTAELVEIFRTYSSGGISLYYGPGFIRTKETFEKLKKIYFKQAWNLMVIPLNENIEYHIKIINSENNRMTSDTHSSLYRLLKTYLSISEETSKDREKIDTILIREIAEPYLYQAILNQNGGSKFPSNLEMIIRKNVGLYCYFLKTGEMPLIKQNQYLVKQARAGLAHIPDSRLIYETMIIGLLKKTASLSIRDILKEKDDGMLSSNKCVNIIYTQEGWDRFVEKEVAKVTKEPIIIDWVSGLNDIRSQTPDRNRLKSDLISFYVEDVCKQWLSFINSIQYNITGNNAGLANILQKLSGEKSVITVLLENVLTLSEVTLLRVNSDLKNFNNLAGEKTPYGKLVSKAENYFKSEDPSEYIDLFFEPLHKFIKYEEKNVGISAYKENVSILSDALLRCANEGNFLEVFSGKDSDPLLNAWKTAEKGISTMPDYLQKAIDSILKRPLEITAEIIQEQISMEINKKWDNHVVAVFNSKLAGKYPINNSKEDARLDDVMEFFRPATGVLYGFYSSHLSPYIIKDNDQWKSRKIGCVSLSFKKEFIELLNKADKISNAMLTSDGTIKHWNVTMMSLAGNKVSGSLIIGKKEYELLPDKISAAIIWPESGSANEITLKLIINYNYTDEITFSGDWALVKLFQSAEINIQNNSSIVARWGRNIQNMIILHYGVKAQFSGTVLPFAENIFSGFNCPMVIIE